MKADKPISKREAADLRKKGWKFDWSKPQKEGCDVFKLYVSESDELQGLIAIKNEFADSYTYVNIVENAPHNVGHTGKYQGCGAHLFAIACKESWDNGFDGYVVMVAKTNLIHHYESTLHAQLIGGQRMYLDSKASLDLIKKYLKEEV